VKRLVILLALLVLLASFALINIIDTNVSVADTNTPDNRVTSRVSEAGNHDSAAATITITMYAVADEEWS
jgi:hypothetical protein